MTTEPRYMRGDQITVNGLTAYNLGQSQSTISAGVNIGSTPEGYVYIGIKVYKRTSEGTETEISSGVSAIASHELVVFAGLVSATWACPSTVLLTTDSIVVKVYANYSTPPTTLRATYTTEQLGVTQLDPITWTVYYWLSITWSDLTENYSVTYRFGISTYNTRITNFSYSTPSGGETVVLSISEILGMVDSRSRRTSRFRTYLDKLGLVDQKYRTRKIYRTFTDSIGNLDVFNRSKKYCRNFAETLGILDSKYRSISRQRNYSESIDLVDSRSRSKIIFRTISEKLGIVDSYLGKLSEGIVQAITRIARHFRRYRHRISVDIYGQPYYSISTEYQVFGVPYTINRVFSTVQGTLVLNEKLRTNIRGRKTGIVEYLISVLDL